MKKIEEIKKLINSNKTKIAFIETDSILLNIICHDEATRLEKNELELRLGLLKSRYNAIEKAEGIEILERESLQREKNKLNHDFLNYINNEIEPVYSKKINIEISPEIRTRHPVPPNRNNWKVVILIGLFSFILGIITSSIWVSKTKSEKQYIHGTYDVTASGVLYFNPESRKGLENFITNSIEPQNFNEYRLQGAIYHQLDNIEKSIQFYKKALQLNGQDANLNLSYALALMSSNKHSEAATIFREKIIKKDTFNFQANYYYGVCLIHEGAMDEAKKYFKSVINEKNNTGELGAFQNYGVCCFYTKDYNNAWNCFNHVIDINPAYSEAYFYRGLSWYYLGNKQNCLNDISIAFNLNGHYKKKIVDEFLFKEIVNDPDIGPLLKERSNIVQHKGG